MLAQDEVQRRDAVMESATTLIDAYLALGDIDAARGVLDDSFEEGKQWLVVDALLKDGRVDDARRLFEEHRPFQGSDDQFQMGIVGEFEDRLEAWSRRAILFLDAEQIKAELAQVVGNRKPGIHNGV